MSHCFFEGEIYHKRLVPKKHDFTYPFFLLDIDMRDFESLKTKFFSINKLNLFSFFTKDHFGKSEDFRENIAQVLSSFDLPTPAFTRFVTLPRIFNFVFNPISILVLMGAHEKPTHLLVEVHNYNGGRVLYPVELSSLAENKYTGSVQKDMYVSPFLQRDGLYKFTVTYTKEQLGVSIALYEDGVKTLIASFSSRAREFSAKSITKLFWRHLFLTFGVVTRTLWQSLLLYLKGIQYTAVTPQDTTRRH